MELRASYVALTAKKILERRRTAIYPDFALRGAKIAPTLCSMNAPFPPPRRPLRVLVLGATGTAGQAAARALVQQDDEVVCLLRPRGPGQPQVDLPGTELRFGQTDSVKSVLRDGFRREAFDAVVSCMASRTGVPADAWAVDHDAQSAVLEASLKAGVDHFVLLSAICVQKPVLAFQHAKLAFEERLIASGMTYSIVRPTAFFKSLSGQIDRVRRGKPYLIFGMVV